MFDEEVLERVTGPDPVWSVIWLHGLGADNTDFQDLPKLLALQTGEGVRFLLPNAPLRPITLNGGAVMRGWYDIAGLDMALQKILYSFSRLFFKKRSFFKKKIQATKVMACSTMMVGQ